MDNRGSFDTVFPLQYPSIWSKTSRIQLLYSMWANMTSLGVGLALAFSSITVSELETDQWMVRKPTEDEVAIVASSLSIAAPIGCIICGIVMDRLGRRIMMISCLLPMMIGWTYSGLASQPKDLIIGRVITGIGIGMAASPPRVFSAEITLPNMRATVGSFPSVGIALGMTIQAGLGFLLNWRFLCLTSAAFSLIVMFTNCYLPESPYYVLMKSTIYDAEDVLRHFRSDSYDLNSEIRLMNEFKEINSIRRLNVRETLSALLKPSACKPFWIIMVYLITAQFSGNAVIHFWTVDILKSSGATIDPYLGNLMINITRLLSCIGTSIIIFWVAIRPLALISLICVGCACICLSMQTLNFVNNPVIPPEIGFVIYVIFGSVSFHSLPLTLLYELVPLQIRGILGGIATGVLYILIFATCETYFYLKASLGFGYTILFYGVCALLGCVFLFFFLPETKGLTLQEIEEYYNDLRTTLTSQHAIMSVQKVATLSKKKSTTKSILHIALTQDNTVDGTIPSQTGSLNDSEEDKSITSKPSPPKVTIDINDTSQTSQSPKLDTASKSK